MPCAAGDRGDDLRFGIDVANAIVPRIDHKNVTVGGDWI